MASCCPGSDGCSCCRRGLAGWRKIPQTVVLVNLSNAAVKRSDVTFQHVCGPFVLIILNGQDRR